MPTCPNCSSIFDATSGNHCPRCGAAYSASEATWSVSDANATAPLPSPADATFSLPEPAHGASLTASLSDDTNPPGDAPSHLPRRIGRFDIRRLLGEGAFGRVYEAHDPQLDRIVALKVAKPERLTDERRVQRFLREAKASANLRHPNIVPVFDSGRDGPHYYIASAFVPGSTLERRLLEAPPDARTAAVVVRHLAEALGYAHSRGVVHRDVKPANVLLDETGEPLLADFGLAARESGEERLTQEGGWVGTPAYLAPEQAAGEALPASDQYSLGCVLYELLTGQTPFDGPPELVVFLHSTQPPPAPRQVKKSVPRDLETIALKCLEKSPAKRYADCQALADDLRRWLEGEPITARRLGLVERVGRWVKREPKLAAAVGLVAALLVGITGLSAWSAVTYKRLTKEATESAEEAGYRFGQARQAVDDYLLEVEEDEALQTPQLRPVQHKLLKRGLAYYDDFLSKRADDPKLRAANAEAHLRSAFIQQTLGNKPAALAAYATAFPLVEELVAESPGERAYLLELARGFYRLGMLHAPSVQSRAETRAAFDKALAVLEPLSRQTPDDADALALLARVYNGLGEWHKSTDRAESLRQTRQALDLRRRVAALRPNDHRAARELADSHANLGVLQTEDRELKAALASYEQAMAALTGSGASLDRVAAGQRARRMHDVGVVKMMMGESAGASDAWRESLGERERLVYTLQPDLFADLARTSNDLGVLRNRTPGERGQAKALLDQAFALRAKLVTYVPGSARFVYDLAESCNNLAQFHLAAGDNAAATQALAQGRALIERLPEEQKKAANFAELLAWNYSAEGLLLRKLSQTDKAVSALQTALRIREEQAKLQPGNAKLQADLAITFVTISYAMIDQKRYSEALPYAAKSAELLDALHRRNPEDLTRRGDYGAALDTLGFLQLQTDSPAEAARTVERAVEVQRAAFAKSKDRRYRVSLASHYKQLTAARLRLREPDKAALAAEERGKLAAGDANELFEVACDLAQCMPLAEADAARRYGELAIQHLQQAVTHGFKDKARWKTPALDPVRGRAEFKELEERLSGAV